MAVEKAWPAIPERSLTADGGQYGELQVSSTEGFKVKQIITIKSDTQQSQFLEVKRVVDENLMFVGPSGKITDRSNITTYTTADNARIYAKEQRRPKISPEEYERAVYEEEPTVAKRIIPVDQFGKLITKDNPLPTSAQIDEVNIDNISVQLDHVEDDEGEFDSTRIGNGVAGRTLEINKNKDIDLRAHGWTIEQKLKEGILCAEDVTRSLTWVEVDGVQRVSTITFSSSVMNIEAEDIGVITTGQTINVVRTFTYEGSDPYNLISYNDTFVVVTP